MTILKRLAAGLIGAVLLSALFSACAVGDPANGSAPVEETPKGSYIETDITPPDANGVPFGLWVHDDGSIDYCDRATDGMYELRLFHSNDKGATWQAQDMSWQAKLGGSIMKLTMTPQGDFFAAIISQSGLEIYKVSKDGTFTKVPITELEGIINEKTTAYPSQLEALSEDSFFLNYTIYETGNTSGSAASSGDSSANEEGSAEDAETTKQSNITFTSNSDQSNDFGGIYKTDGTVMKQIDNLEPIKSVTKNDSALFCMDYLGNVRAYDCTNGNILPQFANNLDGKAQQMYSGVSVDNNSNIYLASNKSIQRMVPGGSLCEDVIEGSMFSFGSPNNQIQDISCIQEGDLLLTMLSATGGKLFRYYFDENASAVPEKTITAWSLKESETVRAAITAYQQVKKDVRVNYEVAITKEDTSVSAEDAMRTLNTELLSGKGPDILIMDGLDYRSYQQKGMLSDISTLADTAALYENIIKPFMAEDGLFVLPARFSVPVLFGEKDKLDAYSSLQNIVTAIESSPPLAGINIGSEEYSKPIPPEQRTEISFGSLKSAFDFFYSTSANAIITKETGVQKEALKAVLTAVKAVSDKCGLAKSPTGPDRIGFGFADSNGTTSVTLIDKGFVDYSVEHTLIGGISLSTLGYVKFLDESGLSEQDVKMMPGLSSGVFQPSVMAAINVNSKMQEEAAGFVKALLSPEVQNFAMTEGLPIMKSGMKALIEQYNKNSDQSQNPKLSLDIEGLIAQLSTSVTPDNAVTDIIFAEVERFCKGEITIDEAVQAIISGTEMYLAEKQ